MRCPSCGGQACHIITDLDGNTYYRCMTGQTSFQDIDGKITRTSRIIPCDTIIDNQGKVVTGRIAYQTDDKFRTVLVKDGKVQ